MGRGITALLLVVSSLLSWSASAGDDRTQGLQAAIAQLRQATLKGDYQTLVAMTHPKAIAAQGGKQQALVNAQTAFQELQASGMTQTRFTVDKPGKVYAAGDDWVTFLTTHSQYQSPSQHIVSDGYLIAVRAQKGTSWHFIDGAGVEFVQQIYQYFPKLPAGISIPKKHSKIRLITPWTPKQAAR
ncbi:hypothetical protein [Gallaecimonas sp. GXIMD1310]|uniref:hypothetical protein n=1 Tax=Gallaecimonas sp. GXIMD1310 TaxID=3131926 RepID=UPI003243DD00